MGKQTIIAATAVNEWNYWGVGSTHGDGVGDLRFSNIYPPHAGKYKPMMMLHDGTLVTMDQAWDIMCPNEPKPEYIQTDHPKIEAYMKQNYRYGDAKAFALEHNMRVLEATKVIKDEKRATKKPLVIGGKKEKTLEN